MAEKVQFYGTGRRKTAIARVYLRPGSGDFKVNGKSFDEYFVTPSQRIAAKRPLVSTDNAGTFNVLANVNDYIAGIGNFANSDPNQYVAGAAPLQQQAWANSAHLSGWQPQAATAANFVTAECIQIHGGVGYTWSNDAHLYLRRAKVDDLLMGAQGWQRERVADEYFATL